jgi:hypothetical protein
MRADNNREITLEQIEFISEELKKSNIPTDNIKEEFFRRFFPDIEDENIKDFFVIMNKKYKIKYSPEWIIYDNFIPEDKIFILNNKGWKW